MKKHVQNFFGEISKASSLIELSKIDDFAKKLHDLRKRKGRLFFLGVGGGAGNCSHAVNDFRKLCNIESYCITDNISELTARINDEGWDTSFSESLKVSKLTKNDAIFILSVGGGDIKKKISVNIVNAAKYAKKQGSIIFGVIGNNQGYINKISNNVIVVPTFISNYKTPIVESFQVVIWHCLVSHPLLQKNKTKW
tara:strand:+ start:38 stop:625 length:588 start_codon:yes stop_codon:yes gene_type:complete